MLKTECAKLRREATKGGGSGVRKYVTGIFEASVLTSLSLIDEEYGFGIVSTGKVWEKALRDAVVGFLGGEGSRFTSCETTGLNASELHDMDARDVRESMMVATKCLLARGQVGSKNYDKEDDEVFSRVQAICLGCAGMVGLEEAVRSACVEVLGERRGGEVHIVDGVKAGIGILYGLARGGM
jgi:Asp/Glu/hydantoin racemase